MDIDKGKLVSQDMLVNYQFFNSPETCDQFLKIELLPLLQKQGYLAASLDSLVKSDTKTVAWIHLGAKYSWGQLKVDSVISAELLQIGLESEFSKGILIVPTKFIELKERILDFYENNGYPFAAVKLGLDCCCFPLVPVAHITP